MPTDSRLKYIDSQIADLGSQDVVDQATNKYSDIVNLGLEGLEGFEGFEGFEGGIHVGRARTIFLVLAAMIMILYVLDE
jgi:hypothetical protein